MRKLIYGITLCFVPALSFGAWANVSMFATSATITDSTSFVVTTSSTLDVGHVGICVGAVNNDGNGTDTDDFTTVTDSAGNVWTVVGENERDPGAPAAGAAVGIAVTLATVELATGATITFNYGATQTAKAVSCQEFTVSTPGLGQSGVVSSTGTEQKEDVNTDAGVLTLGSLPNAEHLWIRGVASETTDASIATVTAGWTGFIAKTHSTGTEATSMGVAAEFRILTNSTATSDPTMTDTTADRASSLIALNEALVSSSRRVMLIQ